MENVIVTENSELDEKGRKVSQYCLGLPTVLRKILEQISTRKLIELSLVSKLWNFEARCVMRERGNLIANIRHGGVGDENRCEELVAFASVLEKMHVVPFCGARIDASIDFRVKHMVHSFDCHLTTIGLPLETSQKVILDRLPWKHFSVSLLHGYSENCPALVLVRRVLEDYCEVLEELTLGFGQEKLLQTIFQERTLPRLTSLTIESFGSGEQSLTSTFVRALVSCAPNLKQLHVDKSVDLSVNVLEGSSAVLLPKYRLQPLLKPISDDLIGSIRMDAMEICLNTDDIGPGLLNRFIPKLLEAFQDTLKTLVIDVLFALPLMCYGICLENVTTLEIYMDCYSFIETSILNLTTVLDFTRVFPKLNQATSLDGYYVHFSADVISAFVEEGNAVLSRALPDRAVNIKRLNFDGDRSIQQDNLLLLAQMFPDVQTVHRKGNSHYSYAQVWEHFLSLEQVIES